MKKNKSDAIKSVAKHRKPVQIKPSDSPQKHAAETRKRIKLMLAILTVLALDLAINMIGYIIVSFKDRVNPLILTFIGMTVIAVIFFPAASLEHYINRATEWVIMLSVKIGSLVFEKKKSLYLMFIIVFGILYGGFYWIWFGNWPFQIAAPARQIISDVSHSAEVEELKKTIHDLEQKIEKELPRTRTQPLKGSGSNSK